jgi:polyisoprenoid-binding protein YceI
MKNILILILILSFNAVAANDIKMSKINFVATGKPSFIKAKGVMKITSADFVLEENILNGFFIVSLADLDSGIELRDKHLKEEYLEIQKFPEAKLVFTNQKLLLNGKLQKVPAKLFLHGVEKEIELNLRSEKKKDLLSLKADFNIILTDHKIELPSFQGITAAKKVKVQVESKLGI